MINTESWKAAKNILDESVLLVMKSPKRALREAKNLLDRPLEQITAEKVAAYIHPGNKLAVIIGFTKNVNDEAGRNIAMQVAAMAPVALDKTDVPQDIIDRELEIGRELARKEGKPEAMIDKIAQGKLNKFYSESTLLNQEYIRESKKTVAQYLAEADKDAKVTSFKRIALG